MSIIKSMEELAQIKKEAEKNFNLRKASNEGELAGQKDKIHILVCGGTGCQASDSTTLLLNLKDEIKNAGLENEVEAFVTGCFGFCEKGPIVKIFPENVFYVEVTPDDAKEIISEHVVKGNKIERLLFEEPTTKEKMPEQNDMPFYKKQMRIALQNCGLINPENVEEYIANDGYKALGTVLTQMKPLEVVDVVKDSGIRGRGGGGFPTGVKWGFATQYDADQKYVICNADEGDPGAFMDRSILEGDPHSVLEAMAIAGYAIGAGTGYIYIRAEYPLAIKRLQIAMDQAKERGLLGKNIFGTGFDFDIELKYGAGAFVCGEETALIHSIEGKRGEPTTKPPFPAQSGVWGKPTIVNNVETLANIPIIINKGSDWFKQIGSEKSPGTKVFALAGKINNVGLVEVPMGITLRDIIYDIGGGIKYGKKFKAVQTGGPSGGCITAEHLDSPIDYDTLIALGSMMGSGGMIVLDEDDCMVNISKFYLEFTVEESCGKCTPCRVGNRRLLELLEKITAGEGTMEDLDTMEELAHTIKDTSLCGLGQTAPNPVISTLKYFRDEYEAHVKDKHCPAGVCQALLRYEIIEDKCIGCTACAKACPVKCISGKVKEVHHIDQSRCIKCGACYEACKFDAIAKK
ncbi:MAG TPA: NADH-quinone oxidoreductase subunit NuoF [Eubacteriaceae bacterium]|nr:NADH-quinone oxidoreductase subunit NuoF [Eubacteriaceae bacterium]